MLLALVRRLLVIVNIAGLSSFVENGASGGG
jgi:hypothetical protein